ncbi:DUF4595 domain-containing protein [uncultured Bacteroides sp.]|uniref:DUF4595 domain-containing protein n=1 Tax=uncultured Bacteroides sp. TaxID=162156 RepID=UPI00259BD5A9|nr:DUF4595 domain-containing protein [uncultured Bacteroides sp.]
MKPNRRVTIITRFSGIMFSLLLLGGLAACSDDNNGNDTPEPEPSTYPTTPFSKIELKEVIESDAQPVTATHTYLYNSAGRLTSYTGKQSFTAGDELFEIENTTTVEYKDHQAVITDEAGTVSTYTLNDKGYATTCTSQDMAGNTRTYTFSYLINTEDKYYLENITEKLDDGKEYSFITIDYSNFRALRIQQKVDTFEHNSTATTPSGNEIANISEIPSLFITDMYPLSMHAVAIYGKILGEPANYLITQLIPDSNGESEETTTYTYTLDNRGIVTSCHAVVRHIRNGYEQDYTRTVNYTIE